VCARVATDAWPNFDFLRLAAATLVVFSHAFLIGEGSEVSEPFVRLNGPHNALGVYGVHCFFIISGFLVTASLVRSASTADFLWRRFLRIYPALIVSLVLFAFLLVVPFNGRGPTQAFATLDPVKFIAANLVWPGSGYRLVDVSFYPGQLGVIVNGSLWSLGFELLCYSMIAAIGYIIGIRASTIAGTMLVFLVGIALSRFSTWNFVKDLVMVTPGFFAGSLLFAAGLHKRRSLYSSIMLVAASGAALAIAFAPGALLWVFPIAAACPLLLLATSPAIRLPRVRRIGDISYGTYLYGWPVEQVLRSFVGPVSGWLLFAAALPIAYLSGYASWRLVERPALRLKSHRPRLMSLAGRAAERTTAL
jgi:peptidoglycan/LPS O-acetylase OafA/YrhL